LGLLYIIIPPLFQNISNLVTDLPETLESKPISTFLKTYLPFINSKAGLINVLNAENIGNLWKNFFGFASEMSNFLLVLLIAFYLSIEKR
jgi:predicted PurR-regulated permease PerM